MESNMGLNVFRMFLIAAIVILAAGPDLYSQELLSDSIAPSVPSHVQLLSKTSGTIDLTWNASVDNSGIGVTYDIYFDDLPQETNIGDTAVHIENLTPGQTYTIYIISLDDNFNMSAPSETLTVTMDPDFYPPEAPANVKIEKVTAGTITFSWSPSKDDGAIANYIIAVNDNRYYTHTQDTMIDIWYRDPLSTHTMKVKAIDYGEHESAWSAELTATTTASKGSVLFIGNQAKGDPKYRRKLILADVELATIIEDMGYNVTFEGFYTAVPSPELCNKYDLVFVSSTLSSKVVKGYLTGTTTPLVIAEVYIGDDMGLWQDEVRDSVTDSVLVTGMGFDREHNGRVTITDNSHPLAAGLEGTFNLCTNIGELKWVSPADAAFKIAALENATDQYVIAAYEKGAILYDGTAATSRMVAFGLGDYTARYFTCEGLCLLKAAITWALNHAIPKCPCATEAIDTVDTTGQKTVREKDDNNDPDRGFCGSGTGVALFPLVVYLRVRRRKKRSVHR
jgi:hypothetical protein